jgi:hypothetical protein
MLVIMPIVAPSCTICSRAYLNAKATASQSQCQ